MDSQAILVVDDDDDLRTLVTELLRRSGYRVVEARDGKDGLRSLYAEQPDLVILDVTMPELDGWKTLERIRDVSDVPVLMLTARDAELERVRGLQAGADDYVTKPFGRQELLARVQAVLRRTGKTADVEDTYADGVLSIDFKHHELKVGGRDIQLTPLEFRMLSTFVRHPNQVLSREQLLELVWGDAWGRSSDQVKLTVSKLRAKLSPHDPEAAPIETVRGFGYRYRPPVASSAGG